MDVQEMFDMCAVHSAAWDSECETCVASMEAVNEHIQKQISENQTVSGRLRAQGAALDNVAALHLRLETLIALVLPGKAQRLLDVQFNDRLAQTLEQMEAELARTKLTRGVNGAAARQFGNRHGGRGRG